MNARSVRWLVALLIGGLILSIIGNVIQGGTIARIDRDFERVRQHLSAVRGIAGALERHNRQLAQQLADSQSGVEASEAAIDAGLVDLGQLESASGELADGSERVRAIGERLRAIGEALRAQAELVED